MSIVNLPIAGGFYKSDSLPLSQQECINCYPNVVQANALNAETIFATPGIEQLVAGQGSREINRGAHVLDGVPYFVNGTKLYRLNRTISGDLETFTVTAIGTIPGTGRVSMADNGTQLCILVPGGNGYIFTASPDTLTQITDADFTANGNPQHVRFIDGYFLFTTDSKKFILSALNDGLAYNALDFGSAEADPDDIVAPIIHRNQLFIGGSETIEGFQNIGGADFPFTRTGVFIDKGIDAPFSIINANDVFMFIGSGKNESPAIWAYGAGSTPQKISTTAIDSLLQGFTDTEISEAFAWSYAQSGAYFVGFSLPTTTLVFDTVSGRWHERKSQITDYAGVTSTVRSRVNSVVSGYGRVLVGDSQDGRIGSMDLDVLTEYSGNIIRTFTTQPFQNNMQSFTVPWLEMTVESGVGNDDAEDPQIRMSRSLDGRTWLDERARSMGKVGEYNRRAIWRRCGRVARFESFRFTCSDPVKFAALQLTAEII